ncbi:MAG: DNA repair protein RecO C-terminal domain-containing protein, partial [Cyanobacteria bacterium P01_D01_bin.36]
AGRSGLFVVNDILLIKGKSIDKLVQAETIQSFPGLSRDLAKLTASQYLAELTLAQALTEQPQEELYYLLIEHLERIESASKSNVLACLAQATFHLLALAGVAPEVFRCCLSRVPLSAELGNPDWSVGFSVTSGGAVATEEIEKLECDRLKEIQQRLAEHQAERAATAGPLVFESSAQYSTGSQNNGSQNNGSDTPERQKVPHRLKAQVSKEVSRQLGLVTHLSAAEIALMQQLSKPELVLTSTPTIDALFGSKSGTIKQTAASQSNDVLSDGPHIMWRHIEKALRQYAQYQFDRPIRSAALIDTCFSI